MARKRWSRLIRQKKRMLNFHIISLFPEVFPGYFNASILGRAQKNKLLKTQLIQLRDFALDKHHTTDETPYGGGPGMVLKAEPIYKAVEFIKRKIAKTKNKKTRVILFSTRGKLLDQKIAKRLFKYDHLVLICGRYEGVDERVAEYIADEEISVGPYILSGGELPAMILTDAVARQVPGVLGKTASLEENKGSYPVYTKPEELKLASGGKTWRVPKVLLSGNHAEIEKWRKGSLPKT